MFNDSYTALKAAIADWLVRGDLTTEIPEFIHLAELNIEQKLNFVPNKNDTYTDSATMTADQGYIWEPFGCVEPIKLRIDGTTIREVDVVSMNELVRKSAQNQTGIPKAMASIGNMRTGTITGTTDQTPEVRCASTAHGLSAGDTVYISGTTSHNGKWTVYDVDTDWFEITDTYVGDEPGTWETYQGRLLFDESPSSALDYTLFYKAKFAYLHDQELTWLLANHGNLLLYGSLLEASPFIKDDQRVGLWASRFQDSLAAAKRQVWRRRLGGGELRVRPDVPLP